MTLRTRRFIYLLFVTFFLITAPLVVLYTTGYRWNYYKNKVDKIGNLVIRTFPKKVNISLNDNLVEKTTPWRFNNLLPNKYQIKITKDGFSSWEKNLNVNSGETTFAEHIYLFKTEPKLINLVNQVDFWTYNEQQNILIYQKNNQLKLLNLNNNLEQIITDNNLPILDYNWSNNYQNLLLTTLDSYLYWRLSDPSKVNIIPTNIKNSISEWQNIDCKQINDNAVLLLCAEQHKIFNLDPFTLTTSEIISSPINQIIDFYFANNLFFYLEKNQVDNNIYLRIKQQNLTTEVFPDYLLPFSEKYKFIDIKNQQATILDQKNKKLYLLNLTKDEAGFNNSSKIYNDIEQAFFASDGTLVFYNPWEVWIERNNYATLITRQSEPITSVKWYNSNNHLLLVEKNHLAMIELDERDRRNIAPLINMTNIKKASFDKTGNNLFFSAENTTNQKDDIFMTEILPKETDFSLPNLMP